MKYLIIFLLSLSAYGETITSPNMSLPVPVVGTTPGPAWANNINSCMSIIDSHDHTPGYGVQIPPDGLNINANLTMGNNSLTSTKSVGFQTQTSLSSTQNIYSSGGDLYYNDASGNVVRITQNGSVTGATGTITGLPSGTASASYQSSSGTFQFQSSTSTPANISGASYLIQQQTTSPNGITIQSPNSLSAAYSLTLPTGLPAAVSFLMESTAGVFSNRAIKVPTVQKLTSGSAATYTTPSGTYYIRVRMVGGGGGGANITGGFPGGNGSSTTFTDGSLTLTALGGTGGGVVANGTGQGGAGGSATISSGTGLIVPGNSGNGAVFNVTAAAMLGMGGSGGGSMFGGAGAGQATNAGTAATAGVANSGGGGGGNSENAGSKGGGCGGGGAGGIDMIITNPAATYTYTIGAGGTRVGAATDGGSGVIYVEEFYQ